jgi:hypothetical protein
MTSSSWSFGSRIRSVSEDFSLVLKTDHHLVSEGPAGHTGRTRIPNNVDVLAGAVVVFTISGIWNRIRVSDGAVLNSALAGRLFSFLDMARMPVIPDPAPFTVCVNRTLVSSVSMRFLSYTRMTKARQPVCLQKCPHHAMQRA